MNQYLVLPNSSLVTFPGKGDPDGAGKRDFKAAKNFIRDEYPEIYEHTSFGKAGKEGLFDRSDNYIIITVDPSSGIDSEKYKELAVFLGAKDHMDIGRILNAVDQAYEGEQSVSEQQEHEKAEGHSVSSGGFVSAPSICGEFNPEISSGLVV